MAASRLNSSAANIRAVNAAKAIGRLGQIDSLLTRLGTITHNEELAGPMLERVLLSDPAFSQTLPVAFAKYSAEVKQSIPSSIADAVGTLGYPTVRKIVQIVGIARFFDELGKRTSLSARPLLDQAVAVAACAEFLAAAIGQPGHLAFSAGLFANVGVPTLAMGERQYEAIVSTVAGGSVQLHEAEQSAITCAHPSAGSCLLADHGFPEPICAAVANHTDSQSTVVLIRAVAVAELFAHQLGYDGGFAIVPPPFDDLMSSFGCGERDAITLADLVSKWSSLTAKMLY